MNRPSAQLKVGDWWYLPHLDKLVKLDEQAKVQQKLELDNLCQSVLNYFLLHPGRLISKEELLKEVWHLSSVSDGRIARVISILRDALSDDVKAPTYIETINKRGYRFIAAVEVVEIKQPALAEPAKMKRPKYWFWASALACTLLLGLFGWFWLQKPADVAEDKVLFGHWAAVSSMDGFEYYPSLSKDGRYLVYSYAKAGQLKHALILQDLTTQQKYPLVDNGTDNFGAGFSPDGRQIAYQRLNFRESCEIRLLTLADDENRTVLKDEKLTDCGKNSVSARISWAPDGNSILFTSTAENENRMSIYSYDFVTRSMTQLLLPSVVGFGDFTARYSNRGDQIAFLRDVTGESVQLWVMDLTNRETSLVAQLENSYPGDFAWASDDQDIYFPSYANTIEKVNLLSQKQKTYAVTDNRVHEIFITPTNDFMGSFGRYGSYYIRKYNNAVINKKSSNEVMFKSNRNEALVEANVLQDGPVAAVSSRTGLPQIWLQYPDGAQKKLSNFESKTRISELKFSDSGMEVMAIVDQTAWLFSLNGEIRKLESIDGLVKSVSRGPSSHSFYYSVSSKGRWMSMLYDAHKDESKIVSSGTDLYQQSTSQSYVLQRDAQTKRFKLYENNTEVILPAALHNKIAFESHIELVDSGIYFSGSDDTHISNVFFYAFDDLSISPTGPGSALFSNSFSVSPDQQHIYLIVGESKDIDTGKLVIEQ